MKKIAILGSTGSVGRQALNVIRAQEDRYCVSVLSCKSNVEMLAAQIEEFAPALAVTAEESDALVLGKRFPKTEMLFGREGLKAAARAEGDVLLNSLMGMRGMEPTYEAIKSGKDIALANKETLVAGGEIIMRAAKDAGVKIIPVDSEHSAIFQCLQGQSGEVKRIILTASGGPFRKFSKEALESATLQQALRHPKWNMGSKITIDSATLMNKGLEIIEACRLFDLTPEKIEAVIHPQSILHSAVEFADGSVIGQMGLPDMELPISYALGYPKRHETGLEALDFFEVGELTFEEPDRERFPALAIAEDACRQGGSCTVVLNSANEVLVQMFLDGRIGFMDIPRGVADALQKHEPKYDLTLQDVLEIDSETRRKLGEE